MTRDQIISARDCADAQVGSEAPKKPNPCDSCNAGYDNSLKRIFRCGACYDRGDKPPTKWQAKKNGGAA